ncbi:hypothetical protein BH10PSE19_BH10PSE19_15300 [soil metagenome]
MPLADTTIRNLKPHDKPFKLADSKGGKRQLALPTQS